MQPNAAAVQANAVLAEEARKLQLSVGDLSRIYGAQNLRVLMPPQEFNLAPGSGIPQQPQPFVPGIPHELAPPPRPYTAPGGPPGLPQQSRLVMPPERPPQVQVYQVPPSQGGQGQSGRTKRCAGAANRRGAAVRNCRS